MTGVFVNRTLGGVQGNFPGPGACKRRGILDPELIQDLVRFDAGEALDHVQVLIGAAEADLTVVICGVDDQRLAFPVAARVSQPEAEAWGQVRAAVSADDAEVVVSEMGMNHKGEIAMLAGLTHPDIGVYTNIGPVHIEFFGTVEKIAQAKRELLENVKPGGTIVINADNEHVMRISEGFAGRKANLEPAPMPDTDIAYTYADISKARRLLNYEPRVSVQEGVACFWQWYERAVLSKVALTTTAKPVLN